jgi:hypothetical protein
LQIDAIRAYRVDVTLRDSRHVPVRKSPAKKSSDLLAVRPAAGAGAEVRKALGRDADVEVLEQHNLLLVKPRNPASAKTLEQLRGDGKIEFANAVIHDADTGLIKIPTDEIIVRCKRSMTPSQCRALIESSGLEVLRQNEFVPTQFVAKVTAGAQADPVRIAAKLDKSANIEFAAPNFLSQHLRSSRKRTSRE